MESSECITVGAEGASERGKLFIGGISSETGEEVLREHFSKYGQVEHVAVIRDRLTGNGRGFAFVQFSDPDLAEKALDENEIDKHVIYGRTVEVKRAIPRSKYPQTDLQFYQNTPQNPHNPQIAPEISSKKIFVGGLRDNITDLDLRTYFSKFGTMNDAVVMKDKWTKRSRGFGFVTFDSEDSVKKVLETNLHDLNGRMVEVKIAIPKGENNLNNGNNNGGDYDDNNNNGEFDFRGVNGFGYPNYGYKLGFGGNYGVMGMGMNPYYNGYYNYRGFFYNPVVNRVRGGPMGFGGYFGNFGNNGGYFGNFEGVKNPDVEGVALQLESVKLDTQ